MKKTAIISGMIMLISGVLLAINFYTASSEAQLRMGMELVAAGRYIEAIEPLKAGGANDMVIGNAYYRAGQKMSQSTGGERQLPDPSQSQQGLDYQSAMQTALEHYEIHMHSYPEQVPVKFNYEWVLDQLNQDEQEKQEDESQENGDDDQEKQEEDSQDQSEESGDSQDRSDSQESEDPQERGEDQESDSDAEQKENTSNEDENSDSGQKNNESNEGGQTDDERQNDDTESYNGDLSVQDKEAIEQVLQMLQQQEEESLKNNQQVLIPQGQGDKNDW